MIVNHDISIEAYLEDSSSTDDLESVSKEDEKILFSDFLDDEIDDEETHKPIRNKVSIKPSSSLFINDVETPPSERDQEVLFKELVKEHQKRLYRFVIRYIDQADDAADITQQAFVEAARTIHCFRGDSKLSTWLYGIAMNMVRNYIRKMIEQDLYELPVLSYQELTQDINIQPLSRVELG